MTVHAGQGLTVDVTRGVLTGAETRQQLYVMATRGRLANHVYVPIVGDGDEHSLVHPTTLRPETAVDILQTILARDGAARSASTETREQTAPATRLTQATGRYVDALHVAAESIIEPATVTALDGEADQVVRGLTSCAAWPSLRATLLLNAIDGRDPLLELRTSANDRELGSAHDPAAVLTWRIHTPRDRGPLPWLPRVPAALARHPDWGPYLTARTQLVAHTAEEVRRQAGQLARPGWALSGQPLTPRLIEDIEVWRAATGVETTDRRVLGQIQLAVAPRTWQRYLESKLQPAILEVWADTLTDLHPGIRIDPITGPLTHRLAALEGAGVPVTELLAEAAAAGPLPAEQPAAALWWRVSRNLDTAERGTGAESPHRDQPEIRGEQQPPEERWKDWAEQANPTWLTSEHWHSIAEQLDRADLVIMDTTRLSQRLRESPATVVLAILRDYNDPSRSERLQQRNESAEMTVNEYHLHHRRSGSRPTTAPPR